jgi:hypothetical protein
VLARTRGLKPRGYPFFVSLWFGFFFGLSTLDARRWTGDSPSRPYAELSTLNSELSVHHVIRLVVFREPLLAGDFQEHVLERAGRRCQTRTQSASSEVGKGASDVGSSAQPPATKLRMMYISFARAIA